MKKIFLVIVITLLFGFIFIRMALPQDQIFERELAQVGQRYVPGEIIVKFKTEVGEDVIANINSRHGASVFYRSRFAGFRRLRVPRRRNVTEMLERYRKEPNVEYAELNYIAYTCWAPNDTYYSYQWNMDNPDYGGIRMEDAWGFLIDQGLDPGGSPDIIVAVVDTGVAYEDYSSGRRSYYLAPDLAATNFVQGYDFVEDDSHANDDNGHGTHVTGTIAQSTDNGLGVAGVAFNCSIMPVKVLNRYGSGTYADVADGIIFAADNGAHVINLSLGGSSPSTTLRNACAYAYQNGVTIVCAAGNNGEDSLRYPAAYDDYCIAVGATRYDETLSYYSNYGNGLDLVAPGGDLHAYQSDDQYGDGVLQQTFSYSTANFGYWFYQGTSMATPHVSGVAALLISSGVAFEPNEVRDALQSTAEDLGPEGWDETYGWGLVDAFAALQWTSELGVPVLAAIEVSPDNVTLDEGETQQFTAAGKDQYGDPIDAGPIIWDSNNLAVGTIDSGGLFTAVGGGTTTVSATGGTVVGTATVTVQEVPVLTTIELSPNSVTLDEGETQQFTAAGKDQYGDPIATGPVAWDSNNLAVGTIDSGGLFTAVAAGTATVSATSGIVVGTASVTVQEVPVLTAIEVSPNSVTLNEGQTQQFTAAGKDQFGDPIATGPIVWDSNNLAVGTIDSGGLFTAVGAGTTTVSATSGTVVGTASVTVQEVPVLTAIEVSPNNVTLDEGQTQQFTAAGKDQFGDPIATGPIVWDSNNLAVGTIDSGGLFTAVGAGTTTVSATSGTVVGTATVNVEEAPSAITVFSDSFESSADWTANWTQDAQNDWRRRTARRIDGSYAAEVDGRANDAQLISIPINLLGKASATITFWWYIERGLDSGEYLAFDVSTNGGSSWTEMATLKGNVDTENTWHSESIAVDVSGSSTLNIRFRGNMSASTEDAYVDLVQVIAW